MWTFPRPRAIPRSPACSQPFAIVFARGTSACAPSASTSIGYAASSASIRAAGHGISAPWKSPPSFLPWRRAAKVAAATQNQALAAILFMYREVLKEDLPWLTEVVRAKTPRRLPTVLTVEQVDAVLARMDGLHGLMAQLMYGTGMRISEALALRVKDLDLQRREIVVRSGKGGKDRMTMLPGTLVAPLRRQLAASRRVFEADRGRGEPGVEVPFAMERKYPGLGERWGWHWVFPQDHLSVDPRSGIRRRHHCYEQTLSRAIARAARRAGIVKHVSSHTFRHYFPFLTMSREGRARF